MVDDIQVKAATAAWLEKVVVGLNFCPFAKREVERQTIRYAVSRAEQPSQALNDVLNEAQHLDTHPDTETTLLIFPNGFADFDAYLDLLDAADHIVIQGAYRGIYQLASFHPDYCFEGAAPDEASNYTNRSPYPTLHLLREVSLTRATAHHPDPEGIPDTNIAKAESMGVEALKTLLNVSKNITTHKETQ